MRVVTATLLSLGILGAGAGGLYLFGQAPKVPEREREEEARPLVRTAPVAAYTQPVVIDMDGEANAFRVIAVGAQVRGQIARKSADARSGMFVEQGEVLFEIDDSNYKLEVERLEAQREQIAEELRAVEIDIQNTGELIALAEEDWTIQQRQLDRIRTLFSTKSTSQSELDATARQELTARNSLQTLKNSLRSQEQMLRQNAASRKLVAAQLKRAETDLARCVVRSPLSGRIVDDIVEQGDFINDGDPLVHISDSSQIEVKCSLRTDDLAWVLRQLQQSQSSADTSETNDSPTAPSDHLAMPPVPCEVVYDFDGTEIVWEGVLARFEGTGMDRDTRTFPCRVTVPEPANYRISDSQGGVATVAPPALISGMYVTVRVPITASVDLLRVPVEAVRPGGQVWLVRNDTINIRQVSVARSEPDHVLIRSAATDLHENDEVVVSPMVTVQDGMQVRVEARP